MFILESFIDALHDSFKHTEGSPRALGFRVRMSQLLEKVIVALDDRDHWDTNLARAMSVQPEIKRYYANTYFDGELDFDMADLREQVQHHYQTQACADRLASAQ